jgi:hypothetical protein
LALPDLVTDPIRGDLGGNIRHGDIHTWCPALWRYLVERFGIRSVLDVGCGEGHAVLFFHRLGLFAHGIDGLALNVARAVVPIAQHDLTASRYIMPVDLVWSCEVAEHIDPTVGHYVGTLTNGRVVAMTHAVPGQDGHHHVNCQPDEYWIAQLASCGYRLSDDTRILREIAGKDHAWNHFARSGLVFTRGS